MLSGEVQQRGGLKEKYNNLELRKGVLYRNLHEAVTM